MTPRHPERSEGPGGAGGAISRLHRAALAASFLATLGMTAGCARTHLTRAEWQRMSSDRRTLYVRTLLGHEKVKAAKGGNARVFDRPAAEYAQRIDDAYARGDRRDADAIFEQMGSKR